MSRDGRPVRLLLVDDDVHIIQTFGRGLERLGYEVATAASVDEAVAIGTGPTAPTFDLLVIDLMLPDGWGASLGLTIRQFHPDSETLFISGYTEQDPILGRTVQADMNFLAKPFDILELDRAIRRVLSMGTSEDPDSEK